MEKIVPITDNKDFLRAYNRGKSFASAHYIIYISKNRCKTKRLGITTGKKCGNSVERSRCRRIIRVIYRKNKELFPQNCDCIMVARKGLADQNAEVLAENFKELTKKFFEDYNNYNSYQKRKNTKKNEKESALN